jgi:toxin CcdB
LAQFAVYRNASSRTYPFLVDIQSDLLDELASRVVIPLARVPVLAKKPVSRLMPTVSFEGEAYLLMTPQLAAIALRELGSPVGTLAAQRDAIIAAMDFLLSGF